MKNTIIGPTKITLFCHSFIMKGESDERGMFDGCLSGKFQGREKDGNVWEQREG